MFKVAQNKYDYGWYREPGYVWGGSVGSVTPTGRYFGPPHSMWYPLVAFLFRFLLGR